MGVVFSVFGSIRKVLFMNISGLPLNEPPICFLRNTDYTITGTIDDGVQEKWNLALKSMIFLDIETRRLLWPIIQKRMDRMESSSKYTNCSLEDVKEKFKGWDDKKIFEIHDLFQAFEVDGDGLIEIAEMSVGLDNLGDKTPQVDRIPQLCSADDDDTGNLDFEEFLQILFDQQEISQTRTILSDSFVKVNKDLKFIRWMSTVQQIRAGYL